VPKLTDQSVRSLPVPERGQKLYSDALAGFAVRVSQGGSKTFVLTVGKERQRITIGRYPRISLSEARQKAARILRDRELGVEHKRASTFEEIYHEYMATRGDKRHSTQRADIYRLKPFLVLGKREITEIEPRHLEKILDALPPVTKCHAFASIRSLFAFALKRQRIERSPLASLDTPPANQSRDRVLTREELQIVLRTAVTYGYPFGTIILLLCLTGQQREQIATLPRLSIDFENSLITWPSEDMKNNRKHMIPFGQLAGSILWGVSQRSETTLFTLTGENPFGAWSKYTGKFRADCGFSDWTLHDLRRTFATIHASLGTPIHIVERLLSHSVSQLSGVGSIYQRHDYLKEAREACERYEAHISSLLPA